MNRIRNFGYFGKGVIAPPPSAPAGTSPSTVPVSVSPAPIPSPAPASSGAEEDEEDVPQPRPAPTSSTSGGSEIDARLEQLRRAVEAKKQAKEAEIQQIRETHWRQANYGRDVVQNRPDRAGYATESEKLMGGRTGYYSKPTAPAPAPAPAPIQGWSGLGAASLSQLTTEIEEATNAVKRTSADVKAGIVPKSDLVKAIQILEEKTKQAQSFKQLSGLSEVISYWPWITGGLAILLAFYLARRVS